MNKKELYDAFAHIDEKYINESSPGKTRKSSGDTGKTVWGSVLPVLLTIVLLGGGITAGVLIARSVRGQSIIPSVSRDPQANAPTDDAFPTPGTVSPRATESFSALTPEVISPTPGATSNPTSEPTAKPTAQPVTPGPSFEFSADGWPEELSSDEAEQEQLKRDCFNILAENYPELNRFDPAQNAERIYSYGDNEWTYSLNVLARGCSVSSYTILRRSSSLKLERNTKFSEANIQILQNLPESRMEEYMSKLETVIKAQFVPGKLKVPEDLRSQMNCYLEADGDCVYLKCESIIYTVDSESSEFGCQGHAHLFAGVKIEEIPGEQEHSGYETHIEMMRYAWDSWGLNGKEIAFDEPAYSIIDALAGLKETGEIAPALSDETVDLPSMVGYNVGLSAPPGTMWIRSSGKIYRLDPEMKQLCRVETYMGEGRVLEFTEELKHLIVCAWEYYPYDYYSGTFNEKTRELTLSNVYSKPSSVSVRVTGIKLADEYDRVAKKNRITVELVSDRDQYVTVFAQCRQSEDNIGMGEQKQISMRAGEAKTVELAFSGWMEFNFQVSVTAGNTYVNIDIRH